MDGARLCLPTGDTVAPLYGVFPGNGLPSLFLLDEFGGLPPGDPGRCETMIREGLLSRLHPAPGLAVPDVDSPDPREAARRYDAAVAEGGLDLALLGLGENGHVGMNEPGSGADAPTRVVQLEKETSDHAVDAYGASRPPAWGITLGMAPLLDAAELWLLVTGPHKAGILREVLEGPVGPAVPASLLREHENVSVLADTSAAALL